MVQAGIPGAILLSFNLHSESKTAGDSDELSVVDGIARRIFVRRDVAHLLFPNRFARSSARRRPILGGQIHSVWNLRDQFCDRCFSSTFLQDADNNFGDLGFFNAGHVRLPSLLEARK